MFSWVSPRLRPFLRMTLVAAAVPVLAAGLAAASGKGARADGSEADKAEQNERCAIRLSIALVGKSPDAALFASGNPQSAIDGMIESPEFAERYARFVNAQFNGGPATSPTEDPVYYLAKHVITNNKPWTDLFNGPYDVVANGTTSMNVTDDPNGLGYFRSNAWRLRYAGNEEKGYMLVAAFRIFSNMTNLTLSPSVGNPGDDRTANGRAQGVCKTCHYDAYFALDKVARVLPMKKVAADGKVTFAAPTEGPQQLLGKNITDDKALVNAIIESDAYRFAQCRAVFNFLYGRDENQCEAPVFDACVNALSEKKTIKAAVAAVAKDPGFCR